LTSITIPDGTISIGRMAFYNCTSLTSIEIPNSTLNIGNGAFAGCESMTVVEIPDGVIRIGSQAFSGCKNMTSIKIPNSMINIGEEAFWQCRQLESIYYDGNHAAWQKFECDDAISSTVKETITIHCTDGTVSYQKVDDEWTAVFTPNSEAA
jgi:hypothetical protein